MAERRFYKLSVALRTRQDSISSPSSILPQKAPACHIKIYPGLLISVKYIITDRALRRGRDIQALFDPEDAILLRFQGPPNIETSVRQPAFRR